MLKPSVSNSTETDSETRKMTVLNEGNSNYFFLIFLKDILFSKAK